jgi:hypothetical protein
VAGASKERERVWPEPALAVYRATTAISPDVLLEAVKGAEPGHPIVYVTGDLFLACSIAQSLKDTSKGLEEIRDCARSLWERGEVHLVRRRLGAHNYEYMAVVAGPWKAARIAEQQRRQKEAKEEQAWNSAERRAKAA